MKHWLVASALLAALAAQPMAADDLESLHILNVNFDVRPGLTLQLHTRGRTFENVSAFNQFRVGPVLMWQAKPRFNLLAGYYFIDQNTRVEHDPYTIQRVWGGGQYRVLRGENWSVDGRSLMERHVSAEFSDYWRFRNRAMASLTTRMGAPFVSGEALVQRGIWYGRYSAGMQWKVHPRVIVGAAYEYRATPSATPGSHVIATFVQWTAHRHTPPHID